MQHVNQIKLHVQFEKLNVFFVFRMRVNANPIDTSTQHGTPLSPARHVCVLIKSANKPFLSTSVCIVFIIYRKIIGIVKHYCVQTSYYPACKRG